MAQNARARARTHTHTEEQNLAMKFFMITLKGHVFLHTHPHTRAHTHTQTPTQPHTQTHTQTHTHTTHTERERERERDRQTDRKLGFVVFHDHAERTFCMKKRKGESNAEEGFTDQQTATDLKHC